MKKHPSLVACRHGESWANKLGDGPWIGDDPIKHKMLMDLEDFEVPLTDLGIEQAEKLGKFLRKNFGTPDVVIDSGYKRAMQTREFALRSGYSQKDIGRMIIRTDDRFRERECGTLRKVGKSSREALPFYDQDQKDWGSNPYQNRPLNGESIADMVPRTRQGILELVELYRGKVVFIFCHGHTLHSLQVPMEGLNLEQSNQMIRDGWVKNCTIHFYKGKKTGWKKMKQFDPLEEKK
ncbi:MAG: histidine phosphatase family protein [Candidatus Vogelbacteria bacterium]|nr:histidine phosphatase family protein [Candidatus Vogelbacteria bacterium]